MRKTFIKLTTGILLATSLVVPVFAKDISILINNKEISTIDKPYIKESRTLVPIRVISENLGIAVDWDNDNRQVILNKENNKIALPIEKNYYFLGNNKIATDISGEIKNDRTFVPIRLIAELFDKEVSWNNDTKSVLINDKGVNQQPINPTKTINNFEQAKVVRVVDGDTIVVDRGRGEEKIRFVLVNTPETKHPKKGVEFYGKEASDFTKNTLSNKTVYLQKDVSETDKYGRLLRYIWIERPTSNEPSNEEVRTKCFNAILLAGGYANVSTFPPDLKYVDLFRQIEREAREKNLGLWSNGKVPEVNPQPSNNNKQVNQSVKNTGEKAYLYANGRIIGNKNSSIYHTPNGRDYKKVTLRNAVFFNTEEEARQAGFRPAKN